ncbi:MAG: SEC-C metal-binding domain-containing protein [Cyclobacteriaceae bacterium]
MEKVGRNEPCPCGSGKKYKNCHMNAEQNKGGKNKSLIIGGILILLLIIGIFGAYVNSQQAEVDNGRFTPGPPPPGQAPPGKVWSYDHGHWHDA